MEILGRAVPAPIFELMLALGDGLFGSFGHGHNDARMVAHQPALLPPQRGVNVRIQIRIGDGVFFNRVGDEVVGLSGSCNAPEERKKKKLNYLFRRTAAGCCAIAAPVCCCTRRLNHQLHSSPPHIKRRRRKKKRAKRK